jgi:hypothetical protein
MTHSTGIDPLDRKLGGGIHPGSIVAIVTPPEAQAEPLLCASIDHRPTQYFTTVRTEDGVGRQLDRLSDDPQLERLEHVGLDGALSPSCSAEAPASTIEQRERVGRGGSAFATLFVHANKAHGSASEPNWNRCTGRRRPALNSGTRARPCTANVSIRVHRELKSSEPATPFLGRPSRTDL